MILPDIGPRKDDREVEQLSEEQSSSLSRLLKSFIASKILGPE